MGIDYSFNLAVGFITTGKNVVKPFTVTLPEKFHMEDRFDPKTGKKLPSEKVVDFEGGESFKLDGQEYDEEYELLEALSEKLGCCIENAGGYTNGETLYVTAALDTDDDTLDEGRVYVGGGSTPADVAQAAKEANALSKKFKKLGIELGEVKVFVQPNIS